MDPIVSCEDAPEDAIIWRDHIPYCPNPECEAELTEEGSITFTERYEASVGESAFGICITRSGCSFTTEACCAKCGHQLDYDDVD